MGRKGSLNHQLHNRMQAMAVFGESRHIAKKEYKEIDASSQTKTVGIHSYNTYGSYEQTCKEFAKWVKKEHGVRNIEEITKEHTAEYLRHRQEQGLSPWTISKDLSALNKVFNQNHTKAELGLRERSRSEITRSRGDREHDRSYNPNNYREQIMFAKATGCRRESMLKVEPRDIRMEDNKAVSVYLKEKGGKEREAPVLKAYQKAIAQIVAGRDPEQRLFEKYTSKIDNHAFRAEYAQNRYKELLNGREDAQDYRGYDRAVIGQISLDLGHNRLNVVVDHYLRQ